MAETVDELTCEQRDPDGRLTTKQVDKVVLTKGSWATIMFLYQDLVRASDTFDKPKVRIQRYQKRKGIYRPQSKFNISSMDQAAKIIEVLKRWVAEYPDK